MLRNNFSDVAILSQACEAPLKPSPVCFFGSFGFMVDVLSVFEVLVSLPDDRFFPILFGVLLVFIVRSGIYR